MSFQVLTRQQHQDPAEGDSRIVVLANDADAMAVPLEGVERIDLDFPAFTDGRAFSQAYLLRRRRRFSGDLRATGDVLIDQLLQMERSGFSTAVLKEGVDIADAQRQLERFAQGFYQADAINAKPHFLREDPPAGQAGAGA